eukprot:4616721-Pleurochrysis_carterae.AAC.6
MSARHVRLGDLRLICYPEHTAPLRLATRFQRLQPLRAVTFVRAPLRTHSRARTRALTRARTDARCERRAARIRGHGTAHAPMRWPQASLPRRP